MISSRPISTPYPRTLFFEVAAGRAVRILPPASSSTLSHISLSLSFTPHCLFGVGMVNDTDLLMLTPLGSAFGSVVWNQRNSFPSENSLSLKSSMHSILRAPRVSDAAA